MLKLLVICFALSFCGVIAAQAPKTPKVIGQVDGKDVEEFTLTDGKITAKFISYGGIIRELHVPDRNGKLADVVLGFDDLKGYLGDHPYFGCITGRVCNRIAKGKFTLDGKEYTLATNNGPNHLHGGVKGFDKKVWKGEYVGNDGVKFTYRSPDGEEGYPGNLDVTVTYKLVGGAWVIEYEAKTDKATPVNLTQHAYFNLGGHNSGDVLGHELFIPASQFTPTDDTQIPTGASKDVKGTPFDFQQPKLIGKDLKAAGGNPIGFDHNFVCNVAKLSDPRSGRVMEVITTEPGIQLYTGNYLDGKIAGKGGAVYKQYAGMCLECQHFPDAVNQPKFKSIILKPGETYRQTTMYRFAVQ